MDKAAFLKELDNSLSGEVTDHIKNDTVNYYNKYIVDEVNKGRDEEDVIKSLGSGNVVAKTVIEAEKAKANGGRTSGYTSHTQTAYEGSKDNEKGLHVNMNDAGETELKFGKLVLNSWYGKLLIVCLLVLFVCVVVSVLMGVVGLLIKLLPVIIVVGFIIWLINFVFNT